MATQYASLLPRYPLTLLEKNTPYQCLSERHMQAVWYEQKYFKFLQTVDGLPISIISPGIWNAEAGPDFKRAHLKIGLEEFIGDVELHLSEEGWYQHHHHEDERYNDVILHLSLWQPRQPKLIKTKQGKLCFNAFLEPFLTISPQRILHLIDLDLYPYKKFLGSGRCAKELFQKISEQEISTFFREAAMWRFEKKYEYLAERTNNMPALGIAAALGYKNNTEQFIELFLWLFEEYRDLPESSLMALALGVSGFFETHFQNKWGSSEHYQELLHSWGEWMTKACHQTKLQLNQVRPFNHPVRRIAYLVKLLGDPQLDFLQAKLLMLWEKGWTACNTKAGCKVFLEDSLTLIPDYKDDYWNWHYTFETDKQKKFLSFMGEDLKKAILINTFLPILWRESRSKDQQEALLAFFHFLPSAGNSKSKYLIHRFFGESSKGKILKKADLEQGAYQLHKDFCIHYEASCEGCPFVANYNKIMEKG